MTLGKRWDPHSKVAQHWVGQGGRCPRVEGLDLYFRTHALLSPPCNPPSSSSSLRIPFTSTSSSLVLSCLDTDVWRGTR
ncbi:hypothetical protein PAMP_015723 [Pampus punctatissimus]